MTEHIDPIAFAFQRGFGPWLTPLRGKIPVLDAWQSLPPVTEETVREWVEHGYNLGLRTGARSGIVVIDDDQAKHGGGPYIPPPTGLVCESPTGGRHYFYFAPDPCPGNSASKLAPHVDVRGEGGQVVYAGSVHPVERRPYRWIETGEMGELPPETLALLLPKRASIDMDRPEPERGNGYADTALVREVARVRVATEGTRNETLNRAAFNLGQLVAGGALSETRVREELTAAASIAGLEAREIESTLRSALTAGAGSPRSVPERPVVTASRPTPATKPGDVLVPGSHLLPPDGDYREQGSHQFAREVLSGLPQGALYRRAGTIGVVRDREAVFAQVSPDALRSVVDEHVRLGAGKESKEDGSFSIQYRPCSRDHAALVIAYAETASDVPLRELDHLASHPVCVGEDFEPARPGWNAAARVYQACELDPEPLDLDTARAVLDDLVVDFPFQTAADRANYFGLLLTPILRPALREPVPMHLIGSPIERSGKTKLAEIVLGCTIVGEPIPATQIGAREEEREKRITAALLGGASVIHLDNLHDLIDSPALASLITSTRYQGRELNHSRMLTLPNQLTIVGTGNNLNATGEIAKRVVPIMLLPSTESPETRDDYRHPLLRQFVESSRDRVLAALLGLIEAWREAGRPLGSVGFGGFERWSAVLGGLMRVAGYPEWLTNLSTWRGRADDFSDELRAFVAAWEAKHALTSVATSDLFDLAEEAGVFSRQTSQTSDKGRRTAFGQRVMNAAQGRVVGGYRIEMGGRGRHRRAWLVPVEDKKVQDNQDNQ